VVAVIAVLRHQTLVDLAASVGALAGLSTPEFWMAIVLVYVVSVKLQLLPATGYKPLSDGIRANTETLVLPTLTLSLVLSAELMRYLRSGMLQVLTEDYVLTDRAKGVPEWKIMARTVFKNALIPFLTVLGLSLARLVGGTIIIETVFALPGMGRLGLYAVLNRDYAVMQAMVLVFASAFIIANLIVDLLYAFVDPRVRYAYRGAAQ
jgi:peptide/nickel transport system permease protein